MRVLRFLSFFSSLSLSPRFSSRYWLVLICYSKFGWPSDWLAEKSTWPLYLPHSSLDGGILPLDSSLIRSVTGLPWLIFQLKKGRNAKQETAASAL